MSKLCGEIKEMKKRSRRFTCLTSFSLLMSLSTQLYHRPSFTVQAIIVLATFNLKGDSGSFLWG